ncbi:MAG: GAF domain-containing protein [Anaerolineae bacterium]
MPEPRVLVITSDYGLLEAATTALARTAGVHAAYSHLDALYALRKGSFDALVVDAALQDRASGEATYSLLSRLDKCPPLVVQLPEEGWGPPASDGCQLVTRGDTAALRRALKRALRLRPDTGELSTTAPLPATNAVWRSDELETFFTLSRSLTEVLDLSEVLNRVVEAARSLTRAEQGMILLPDGETDQLYLRARVGIDTDTARNFRVRTQDTLAGLAFQRGEPVMIGARGPQKVKTEYFVNALLYVPILLKGRPIGVLGVSNRTTNDTFEPRDQELLGHLAAYAAIAIENARVHGLSVKRARELKALVDASEEINATLMLDRTLLTVCSQMMRLLGAKHAEICEVDPTARQLHTLARHRQVLFPRDREPRIPIRAIPGLAKACQTRTVLRLERPGAEAEVAAHLRRVAASSLFIVPLASNAQTVGALLCYSVQPAPPIAEQTVARVRQLGMEMFFAAAQDGERAQRRLLSLADEVVQQVGGNWVQFGLLDGESFRLMLDAGSAAWLHGESPVLDLGSGPEAIAYFQRPGPVMLTRESAPGVPPWFESTAMRTLLGFPLALRGMGIGFVLLGDFDALSPYEEREIDLGRALAGQAGTAIENARLLHDLENSLRELKGTQDRLIQAERLSAMGELAATVAHQINNPLTTIIVDTELLLEGNQASEPVRESLESIMRAGKRAKGVVRRLLATARTAPTPDAMEPVQVVTTIEETLSLVRPHFAREHIEVVAGFPDGELPPVMAAPGELDDVWLNLLLNAHDAVVGRENARIIIEVSFVPGDSVITVYVRDNGSGIPAELIEAIFKPFFTTKPMGHGTGLGLHFCRQVIDRVGGLITVESHAETGTLFTVKLPVAKEEMAP